MRSRAARLTSGAAAWIAITATAVFFIRSEQEISRQRAAMRDFDVHAREACDALADLRSAQQAYVAAGQGVQFWMPKVEAILANARNGVADLRQAARSGNAQAALDEAASTLSGFGTVDKRARDYLRGGQSLMAADVIFTEGGAAATTAVRQVESARVAEHEAVDAGEAGTRKLEAIAAASAGVIASFVVLALFPLPRRSDEEAPLGSGEGLGLRPSAALPAAEPDEFARVIPTAKGAAKPAAKAAPERTLVQDSRAVSPILKVAAELCTELGRVNDLATLNSMLARTADVMDASGLVVWLGGANGAELKPVLANGYSEQVLARMTAVPRSADNAAAAAYRSGVLQIVPSRPGSPSGAVAAPLLSADGCIGALTAEIRNGGEGSESVQALAALVAAQLASVLVAQPEPEAKRAAAGS
jgi:hypothetical protein